MDRTIKFRAWDKGWKQIVYPDIIYHNINSGCNIYKAFKPSDGTGYFPIQENLIVMQFTGLYDCEGKEVWEGDVLEYKEYYANIKWWSSVEEIPIIAERTEQQRKEFRTEKREVRFNQGAFCLGYTPLEKFCRHNVLVEKLESGKQFNGDYEKKMWDFKVIGNLYEHPNLLNNESNT